jgi:nuclear GTP-binding protein
LGAYVRNAHAENSKFEDDFVQKGQTEEAALKNMSANERQMAQSRKAYYKILKAVIEESDVVLQVLDARDPMGCRNEEIEQEALKQNKKVLLILNKIDLVPSQNARMWLRYLRQEFPVILFKANQQKQNALGGGVSLFKQSLIDRPDMVDQMVSASTAVGTENLMNILKNYARISGSKNKKTIYVGVVGFPNVGKSSIINSLKRARAAPTGNMPGVTKSMQEVQLDKNIVLLDSPGVVLSTKEQSDSLILRSAIKVEALEDVIRPVEAIIARIERSEID